MFSASQSLLSAGAELGDSLKPHMYTCYDKLNLWHVGTVVSEYAPNFYRFSYKFFKSQSDLKILIWMFELCLVQMSPNFQLLQEWWLISWQNILVRFWHSYIIWYI